MSTQDSTANELDFDPDALREKYRLERDKRLRSDGNSQYQEMSGEFDHYTDDPYIDNAIKREPLKDEVEIVYAAYGKSGKCHTYGDYYADTKVRHGDSPIQGAWTSKVSCGGATA